MASVLAPVLPYLAEEIHAHRATESSGHSFLMNKWEPLVCLIVTRDINPQVTYAWFHN
jgi:hypothetical protein